MKKIKNGFLQAIISIVTGIILTIILNFLVEEGIIPGYSLLLFTAFNVIANLLTIQKMRYWGLFYTLGWLVATLLFSAELSTTELVLNTVFPVLILATRFGLWVKEFARAR
jgi:hypothetical protein